jgi:hypothetical protein
MIAVAVALIIGIIVCVAVMAIESIDVTSSTMIAGWKVCKITSPYWRDKSNTVGGI